MQIIYKWHYLEELLHYDVGIKWIYTFTMQITEEILKENDSLLEKSPRTTFVKGRTWITVHWENLEVICVFSTLLNKVVFLQGTRENMVKTADERKQEISLPDYVEALNQFIYK